jgi:hypothetical protein
MVRENRNFYCFILKYYQIGVEATLETLTAIEKEHLSWGLANPHHMHGGIKGCWRLQHQRIRSRFVLLADGFPLYGGA